MTKKIDITHRSNGANQSKSDEIQSSVKKLKAAEKEFANKLNLLEELNLKKQEGVTSAKRKSEHLETLMDQLSKVKQSQEHRHQASHADTEIQGIQAIDKGQTEEIKEGSTMSDELIQKLLELAKNKIEVIGPNSDKININLHDHLPDANLSIKREGDHLTISFSASNLESLDKLNHNKDKLLLDLHQSMGDKYSFKIDVSYG